MFYCPSLIISETAALQLGTDRGFMDRLVGWCEVDEHAGVQGKEGGPGCRVRKGARVQGKEGGPDCL